MRAELTDPESLAVAVAGAEIVLHVAGRMYPALSDRQPMQDVEENLAGSVRLIDLSVQAGVRTLVFASSGGTIYGAGQRSPAAETDPTEPISSYGIVKYGVERYLDLHRRTRGLNAVSLRIGNIYGGNQKPGPQGLVARTIECAIAGETIEIWGDGSAVRDYVHIDDVVAALLRAAALDPSSELPRTYNIGSGVGRSVREVLATVEVVHGRPLKANYVAARPSDVPRIVLDVSRARQCLGWAPERQWEAGVRDAYDLMRQALERA